MPEKTLEEQKERVWELYEYLKETEVEINSKRDALRGLERDRQEILDILSGKLPLFA